MLKANFATKNIINMPETNMITNQGMTCTKSIVFKVAMFAVREVKPIHIPNQTSATRLPVVLNAAAVAVTIATTN